MAEKLREVQNAPMRFARRQVRDIRLIDDAYNANPLSMAASLEELARAGGRRVAGLGDMLELGDESVRYHREAGELAARSADLLIAVGPQMKAAAEAFGAGALWFADSKEAAEAVVERIRPGDCVLVKGSRGMAMEHVVRRIEGAGLLTLFPSRHVLAVQRFPVHHVPERPGRHHGAPGQSLDRPGGDPLSRADEL